MWFAARLTSRPPDQKGFAVLPRRWVVEHTFGWLNHCRLLSQDYEATIESSTADIYIAMSSLMSRRLTKSPGHDYENGKPLARAA